LVLWLFGVLTHGCMPILPDQQPVATPEAVMLPTA
jgi:hypothetical protein